MALTDQPYLPLYVDDWMNNNKLKMCSLEARGLMIQIMCVMHKSDNYGEILLGQKFKQTDNQIKNFALQLARLCMASAEEVFTPLSELLEEEALEIEAEKLTCRRMVKDADISLKRSQAGKAGGKAAQEKEKKPLKFAEAKDEANAKQNPVNENESVNVNEDEVVNVKKEKIDFEKIVADYNEKCGEVLPKVLKITAPRKAAINARVKEYKADDAEAFFNAVFDKVMASRFLTGQTEKPFKASFDWITAPSNLIKILENNYTNGTNKPTTANRQTAATVNSNAGNW